MKTYISLIVVLFTTLCMAQQPPVLNTYSLANPEHRFKITSKGSYLKDFANERNQYVGTWQYNQNGILFELKLEKSDQHLFQSSWDYYYIDVISIKYRLVKNGVEIFNNFNFNDPENLSHGTKQSEYDYLNCSFLDATRQVLGTATIKKLQGAPQKILFNLSTGGYMLLGPPEIYQEGVDLFSIPTGPIEMVKIN